MAAVFTSARPIGFVKAINFTLPWETGREKDGSLRKDGGLQFQDGKLPTKYGIWKGTNPDVDVENLTVDDAIDIYKHRYWDIYPSLRPTSANLASLPVALAVATFDSGVNNGVTRSVGWLDAALKQNNPVKALLDARVAHDIANSPKYALKGLLNRINDLRKYCDILERDAQTSFNVLEAITGKAIGGA